MTTPSFLRGDRAGVEPALDHLFTDLTHPESSIRAAAVYTLGQFGDQAATVALLRVLSDRDATVREEAAYALGCLEDVGALAGLLMACYDEDVAVRRAAVEALDKLRALLGTCRTRQQPVPMPRPRALRWTHARIAWMEHRGEPRRHGSEQTAAARW